MVTERFERRVTLLAVSAGSFGSLAQVKTNVPDVVAGARPAIVERITIHGKALEGNLEGDAVDCDAIVFLPPDTTRTARFDGIRLVTGAPVGALEKLHKSVPGLSRVIRGSRSGRIDNRS